MKFPVKEGWIYCFKTCVCTRENHSIYKIGATQNIHPIAHLQNHVGMNQCSKLLFCSYFEDISIKQKIVGLLKFEHFLFCLTELGQDYFSCDSDERVVHTLKLVISDCELT